MLLLGGCSSVMSHTGGKEGTYPGTRASATMIGNDETNWGTKSLAILDMPFTAVMDTILLPWDIFRKDSFGKIARREKRGGDENDQCRHPPGEDASSLIYRPVSVTHS